MPGDLARCCENPGAAERRCPPHALKLARLRRATSGRGAAPDAPPPPPPAGPMFLVTANSHISERFPDAGEDWKGAALNTGENYYEVAWSADHDKRLVDPEERIFGLIKLCNDLDLQFSGRHWAWKAKPEKEEVLMRMYFPTVRKNKKGMRSKNKNAGFGRKAQTD
jgi:hypothetical protein